MLTSVEAVIDALGGSAEAASMAGVGASAVSNWKARGRFPSDLYLLFSSDLSRSGIEADPALFGLRTAEPVEARQ